MHALDVRTRQHYRNLQILAELEGLDDHIGSTVVPGKQLARLKKIAEFAPTPLQHGQPCLWSPLAAWGW